MEGTLIIFILTVSSSFRDNLENQAESLFDVVEWWITDEVAYRIKTYAIDKDMHIHRIKTERREAMIALAFENTQKHYGDVLKESFKIEVSKNENEEEILTKIRALGFEGAIEISDYIFWNPDNQAYSSQSNPNI